MISNAGMRISHSMLIRTKKAKHLPLVEYRIVRNVGGGKHWRIPLKTTLAKKTLAIWH